MCPKMRERRRQARRRRRKRSKLSRLKWMRRTTHGGFKDWVWRWMGLTNTHRQTYITQTIDMQF
jgi:hypothetical protein